MRDLKNPFGLRDGRVVMIEDISENERGLKCNCFCPSCNDPFEARMGNVRVHHFAHSGEGCSEEIAFLSGLYRLVREYILENTITLPALKVYWAYSSSRFNEQDFLDRILFHEGLGTRNVTIACDVTDDIQFETAEVNFNGKRPTALLCSYRKKQIAFRIKPPKTVCKVYTIEPFNNLATIGLDASNIAFGELKKEQILNKLKEKLNGCSWVYSPMAIRALGDINEANDAWIEEKRKQAELLAQTRRKQTPHIVRTGHITGTHKPAIPPAKWGPDRAEKLRKGKEEVKDRFTQQQKAIYDSFGQRWILCRECKEIKPVEDFGNYDYGGFNKVNSGICKLCIAADKKLVF